MKSFKLATPNSTTVYRLGLVMFLLGLAGTRIVLGPHGFEWRLSHLVVTGFALIGWVLGMTGLIYRICNLARRRSNSNREG